MGAGWASEPAADLLAGLLAQARQERRLLSVHWELTHRCNERCRHCFLPVSGPHDRAVAHAELTTGEALALIDQVAALGALSMTFSGGEPLLRPDFWTLAAHVRRRHLGLRIYTNGTLLAAPEHAGWIAALAALHPLAVEISLYAATPAIHNAITGVKGSWAATVKALVGLHAAGVRTVCKTPLMRANAAELAAVRTLAGVLGARFQPDLLITAGIGPTCAARCAPLAERMTPTQLATALRTLAASSGGTNPAASSAASSVGTSPAASPAASSVGTSPAASPAASSVGTSPAASPAGPQLCTIGRSALAVDPEGTVFPCVEVRRSLGSIRATPLAAIWHDTGAWAPYLRLSAQAPAALSAGTPATLPATLPTGLPTGLPAGLPTGVSALPVCRTCRLGAWCIRCHGAAANETGDLYGPSPAHCAAARARRALAAEALLDPPINPPTDPPIDSG